YSANKISLLLTRPGRDLPARSRSGGGTAPWATSRVRPLSAAEASVPRRTVPKVIKLWQTSFHDHIIRDQRDLYAHFDYIHYNPVKHRYVSKPEDWQWSSFRTFLRKGYYEKGWGIAQAGTLGLRAG
ncbi:MAG: hypothetical protein V1685_00315, partial [Parcubacteria group bacterium]